MSGFDGGLPINFSSGPIRPGKPNKEPQINPEENSEKDATNTKQNQNQTTPGDSLVNTNSKVPVNQSTLTSPGVNQAALNAANKPTLNPSTSNQESNTSKQPSQIEHNGAKDLPTYAGISNMSLKSWIAGQENKSQSNLQSAEKELASTLEGIKGFQNQNYEDDPSGQGKSSNKNKILLILSELFGSYEQSGVQDTNLLVNIMNFKKLGSNIDKDRKLDNFSEDSRLNSKSSPPLPNEPQFLNSININNIKHMSQLLALPKEFPEFLRLLAKDDIEIYKKDLVSFLEKRLKYVQEETFGKDKSLNKLLADFAPLVNQNTHSQLLPLILLYYPLPLPEVKGNEEFLKAWKKKEKPEREKIIASCDIYYLSKQRGRFLIKFELNENNEFFFDIQTSEVNNGIVKDIEDAISQSMILLKNPPTLSELNVLLTKEIYNATDIDEELSITSTGPIRLEIVLAVYSALIVLNKLNEEFDPSGLIDIIE